MCEARAAFPHSAALGKVTAYQVCSNVFSTICSDLLIQIPELTLRLADDCEEPYTIVLNGFSVDFKPLVFQWQPLNSCLSLFHRLMCETVRYERHEANEVLY